MKSEEYYEKIKLHIVNHMKQNVKYAHKLELPKLMKVVNKGSYERLIKIMLKRNTLFF